MNIIAIVFYVVLVLIGLVLGMFLMAIFNISKVSALEDELSKEHSDRIIIENQYKKILADTKNKKYALDSDEGLTTLDLILMHEGLKTIREKVSYIIGVADDDSILSECNLIEQEIDRIEGKQD